MSRSFLTENLDINEYFTCDEYFTAFLNMKYTPFLQGVPKKKWISVQQPVEGVRSDLRIKVGGVLKNSGYFLSNEYKNSPLL